MHKCLKSEKGKILASAVQWFINNNEIHETKVEALAWRIEIEILLRVSWYLSLTVSAIAKLPHPSPEMRINIL